MLLVPPANVPQSWIQSDCQTVHPHPAWQDVDMKGITSAWYQREITIPAGWKGRRITLHADCLNSYAAVYLDGKNVGQMYFPVGELDITSACRPGLKQVLSLYTRAAPLKAVREAQPKEENPQAVQGGVPRRGKCQIRRCWCGRAGRRQRR